MTKKNTTRLEIRQVALKMFLTKGYTNTSASAICQKLGISKGNLTYYFPTKEHILAVLVNLLCDFQWKTIEKETNDGHSSLLAYCLELTAMAAICEKSEIGKDFYLSTYTSPLTLSIIRDNDANKAKKLFGEYCKSWQDIDFREAEMLVSGIEYATMIPTEKSAPLDIRIAGALKAILQIYNVPQDLIKTKIEKVLKMDYLAIGERVLKEFIFYTEQTTEVALENLLANNK